MTYRWMDDQGLLKKMLDRLSAGYCCSYRWFYDNIFMVQLLTFSE
jgi:hypothetical protein